VLLQGFFRGISPVGVVRVSTCIGNVSAGFADARATGTIHVRCIPGGVAMRRAPEPGPIRGDRGELFILFQTCPLKDRYGEPERGGVNGSR
jgi:hypothetical protein